MFAASDGFDALRDELGSSHESSVPCGVVSLDVSCEEQDIIKVSQLILRLFFCDVLFGNNCNKMKNQVHLFSWISFSVCYLDCAM